MGFKAPFTNLKVFTKKAAKSSGLASTAMKKEGCIDPLQDTETMKRSLHKRNMTSEEASSWNDYTFNRYINTVHMLPVGNEARWGSVPVKAPTIENALDLPLS